MDKQKFTAYMEAASTLSGDYKAGYWRGLRRHYHGPDFDRVGEHKKWMTLDGHRQEQGDGYRDGFAGKPPRGFHGNIGNQNAAGAEKTGGNLNIRTEGDELALWTKAAQMEPGRTRSDWVRATLNRVARDELGL